MKLLVKFILLGMVLMITAWGCVNQNKVNLSQICDHKEPEKFKVEVVGENRVLKVVPPVIIACYKDEISFEWVGQNNEFEILFGGKDNPFKDKPKPKYDEDKLKHKYDEDKLKSNNGVVIGKVLVNPSRERGAIFIKYDVKAPGYDLLDPKIIITPH